MCFACLYVSVLCAYHALRPEKGSGFLGIGVTDSYTPPMLGIEL